jgi:hypothetical protein
MHQNRLPLQTPGASGAPFPYLVHVRPGAADAPVLPRQPLRGPPELRFALNLNHRLASVRVA